MTNKIDLATGEITDDATTGLIRKQLVALASIAR
jgi:hypothetical protein